DRLRHGQCNYDDYELLQTRVVGQPTIESLHDSPWNKAPILVFRNEVRIQINNKAAIHNATQMGHPPMVCVAQDTCKGKAIEDPILRMPVILTQNIATELGLINGINGIFRQLVYHEDSITTGNLSEMFPNNTQYIRRSIYALIEIAKSKIECKLQDLQQKLIPIPLVEQTFQ
ncbi:unnamed protein product, partial [Adineta ricciae]